MRIRPFISQKRSIALVIASLLCQPGPAAAGEETTEEKVFGEVRPDRALVYLMRPKLPSNINYIFFDLFVDDSFVMRVKGNSYAYAYLEPAEHFMWVVGGSSKLEFVPGEVYYLVLDQALSLLPEPEGEAFLEEMVRYVLPNAKVEEKKQKRAAKQYPRALEYFDSVERAPVPQVQPPARPAATAGLLHVPAHTRLELELMETVSSSMNELGERVWFRVAESANRGQGDWLALGTPVEGVISQIMPRRGGAVGRIEIVVPAVTAADGTSVPVASQILTAGRPRTKASMYAIAFGILPGLFIKGRESFEPPGTPVRAWTRAEVWVSPAGAGEDAAPEGDVEVFAARAARAIDFNPEAKEAPLPVEILIETDEDLASVALVQVEDWRIPTPAAARHLARGDSGWVARFNGWDFVRHLRLGREGALVRFEGTLEDGRPFAAEGRIPWIPDA